jgi:hypothetical protein
MSAKYKKLVLKKAYFPEGFNGSVEQIVKGILEKLPNKNERVFKSDLLKTYEIAHIEQVANNNAGLFVRIHGHENGSIGLINQEIQAAPSELEEHHPPEKRRFLAEEVILYARGNHVLACDLGNKDSLVQNILGDLGIKAGVIDKSLKLKISDVPNKTELKKVKEIGVKKIELGVDGYLASIEEFQHKSAQQKILEKIFGVPSNAESVRKRANTHGRLILSRGGKFKKEEIKRDDWLTSVGETIIDSGADDYRIILEDGTKIATAKLKVSKSVKLKKVANTISYAEAKLALFQFYEELQNNGSLDW